MPLNDFNRCNPRSSVAAVGDRFVKTSSEPLSAEAAELARCARLSLHSEHVRPPEFLSFDEARNTLTTRTVPGSQSLYNALWNGTSLLCRLRGHSLDCGWFLQRAEALGKWLLFYHESTSCEEIGAELSAAMERQYLEKVAFLRKAAIVDNGFLDRCADHFLPELRSIIDPAYRTRNYLRFCRIHGDFNVSNMLVDAKRNLHILDFADSRPGANIVDVARFYELLWAVSKTSRRRERVFREGIAAFLSGYGLPADVTETPFFKAVVSYYGLISVITEYTTRPYIKNQILTRWELKRLAAATMRWVAGEIGVPYRAALPFDRAATISR